MISTQARINIKNLRLRTYIGFNPEEMEKKQDVVINIEILYEINKGALVDHIVDALNYKTITKRVIKLVEEGRFLLLEKMVNDVLGVASEHSSVQFTRVTIEKPHALRFADSVSLSLEYENKHNKHTNLLEKAS